METAESLRKRIKSAQDLRSVVKTMKALAAVSIRQYEKAVESLAEYNRAVEMGLQIALQKMPEGIVKVKPKSINRSMIAIVFGSDQGMCGPLNDVIVSHAMKSMDEIDANRSNRTVFAVGVRSTARLEDAGQTVSRSFPVPNAASAIVPMVQEILIRVDERQRQQKFDRIVLFYSRPASGASYHPHAQRLLPLDQERLQALEKQEWPSRALPTFTMDWDRLFSALIREYFFVSLARAFAESLASENAARLASMQGAEKSIEERMKELTSLYYQQRQTSITEELLDIISGFETLRQE